MLVFQRAPRSKIPFGYGKATRVTTRAGGFSEKAGPFEGFEATIPRELALAICYSLLGVHSSSCQGIVSIRGLGGAIHNPEVQFLLVLLICKDA